MVASTTRRKPTGKRTTLAVAATQNHPPPSSLNNASNSRCRKHHRLFANSSRTAHWKLVLPFMILLPSSWRFFGSHGDNAAVLLRQQQQQQQQESNKMGNMLFGSDWKFDWKTVQHLFQQQSVPFDATNPLNQTLTATQLRLNMFRRQTYATKEGPRYWSSPWKQRDSILIIGEAELQRRAPQHLVNLQEKQQDTTKEVGHNPPPLEGVAIFENVYITGAPPQITFYDHPRPVALQGLFESRMAQRLRGVRTFVPTSCSSNDFIKEPERSKTRLTLKTNVTYLDEADIVVFIADEWAKNYFHTMNDMLPRINKVADFIAKASQSKAVTVLATTRCLVGNSLVENRIRDFWNPVLFGNDSHNHMPAWQDYNPTQIYFVPKLLAPTGARCGRLAPLRGKQFFERLNRRFRNNPQQRQQTPPGNAQRPVILLQKRTGRKRTVANHDELRYQLELSLNHTYDIWEHDDSKQTTLAQYEPLYSQANYLVGPHGAGISNIMLCNKRKLRGVLEFHPKVSNWFNRKGENSPNLCNIDMAKSLGVPEIQYLVMHDGSNFGNMTADVNRILETLRDMIMKQTANE